MIDSHALFHIDFCWDFFAYLLAVINSHTLIHIRWYWGYFVFPIAVDNSHALFPMTYAEDIRLRYCNDSFACVTSHILMLWVFRISCCNESFACVVSHILLLWLERIFCCCRSFACERFTASINAKEYIRRIQSSNKCEITHTYESFH